MVPSLEFASWGLVRFRGNRPLVLACQALLPVGDCLPIDARVFPCSLMLALEDDTAASMRALRVSGRFAVRIQ